MEKLKEKAKEVNTLLIKCFKEKPRYTAEAINQSKSLKVSINGERMGIIPSEVINTVQLNGILGSVICCPQEDVESNFVRELLISQNLGPAGEGERQVKLDIFEEELNELRSILIKLRG